MKSSDKYNGSLSTPDRGKSERLQPLLKHLPLAILVSSLLLTLFLWKMYDNSLHNRAQAIYADKTATISSHIVERLHDHEQVLRGAAGLFSVNEATSRVDWRQYVSALQLAENHPGILGVGFSKWIRPEEKEAHINKIRAEGFPEYSIRPAGERPEYTSIIYLEPFNAVNMRAFGFDMYSESVRRAAMDKARDGNITTIGAKITLVQETDKNKQSGMLMYVPVYKQGMQLDTVERRREAFVGFTYSPIRMNDFVYGTFKNLPQDIAFDITIVGGKTVDNLMFSSIQADKMILPENYTPVITTSTTVQAYGCSWQFSFKSLPQFNDELNRKQSYLFLCVGILFSALCSFLALLMTKLKNLAIRRADEKIDQLGQRLSLATDSAKIGVWEYLIPENQLIWDKWMYALYGVRAEDFSGAYQAWQDGLHPDDKIPGDEAINLALRGEKDFDIEFRVIWPTGEVRHIKANALLLRDVDGNPLRMIGTNYDITERTLAEQNQKESKELLLLILNSVAQAIYGIDLNGRCTFCNQACLDILGYDREEELLGKNMHDQVHHTLPDGSHFPVHECKIFKAFQLGQGTHVDDEFLWRKDGSSFPSEYWSYPQHKNGEIVGAVITFFDITERKQMLEELHHAVEIAEAATIAKSQFLATMSHEIRTPMNGVIGMTGLLLETELTDEQRDYAEIVNKSGESLLGLINDILDFSKIEAGKLDIEIINFDIRTTIEDTAEMLAIRASEAGLELICRIEPDVPTYLKGDPGRLRQIFTNLVGNAVKFTPQGEIVISAALESEENGFVVIRFEIKDTGIGIPEERRAAIFAPFTQVDGSTTRKYGGTGLGLAICKQLTELMGGEIGIESEEGKGSTFWFTSRFEKQAEVPKTSEVLVLADINGVKILVVDDNATNQMLMTTLLHHWGCRSESAVDGETGLALLKKAVEEGEPFRVALLDQEMPGMDGCELGRRIKADPQLASTLMIMVTSLAQRGDAAVLQQIGFTGYLPKPVRQRQLYECIALVLGRGGQAPNTIVTQHTVAEVDFQKNASLRRVRILLAEDNIINQKVAQNILDALAKSNQTV